MEGRHGYIKTHMSFHQQLWVFNRDGVHIERRSSRTMAPGPPPTPARRTQPKPRVPTVRSGAYWRRDIHLRIPGTWFAVSNDSIAGSFCDLKSSALRPTRGLPLRTMWTLLLLTFWWRILTSFRDCDNTGWVLVVKAHRDYSICGGRGAQMRRVCNPSCMPRCLPPRKRYVPPESGTSSDVPRYPVTATNMSSTAQFRRYKMSLNLIGGPRLLNNLFYPLVASFVCQ
jgi:hypothetical protein